MTVTIDIPKDAETELRAEQARTGKPVEELVVQLLLQRYAPGTRLDRLFDDITRPGYVADLSRDVIYADD